MGKGDSPPLRVYPYLITNEPFLPAAVRPTGHGVIVVLLLLGGRGFNL